MIPIRDVIPSRTRPIVTFSLIGANALAFLWLFSLNADAAGAAIDRWAVVPAQLGLPTAGTLVTSLFLHGGWAHLGGNLLFLWIFGDNVEDRFGHGRFLAFYLGAGILANIAQALAMPASLVPVIGASGAIAAVMGAYFVLFPQSRVVMLLWLVIYVDFVEIPAVLFLGFWFVFQLIGSAGQAAGSGSNVAFVAHLGGFVAGVILGRLLARAERTTVAWWDTTAERQP